MSKPNNKNEPIPIGLLDDISSRFILDATNKELEDPIAVCFLTELAYWFYLDEYVEDDDNLNVMKFDTFATQLLTHLSYTPQDGQKLEDLLTSFRDFKHQVPTYGGCLLNEDMTQVLLVQGYYYKESWCFPKGKIYVDEEPHVCAVREVLEETGFDISSIIDPEKYLETVIGGQRVCLYIIPGVPMDTKFVPQTKNEIKELRWFQLNLLPTHKHDKNLKKIGTSSNVFYMVMPFVKPLREWVSLQYSLKNTNFCRESRRRHHSSSNSSLTKRQSSNDYSRHQNSPFVRGESYGDRNSEVMTGDVHVNDDPNAWRKDNRSKIKTKKNAFMGNNHNQNPSLTSPSTENNGDDNQKFSFKNLKKTRTGNQVFSPVNNRQISTNDSYRGASFKSNTWQNFRLNNKAINDALDKVWNGVTL